ncbi:MAG TPA: ATP-binding protein [Blastocatellia bacterium]|nr:ATP-binding protein [Blastocatellia bacterium]
MEPKRIPVSLPAHPLRTIALAALAKHVISPITQPNEPAEWQFLRTQLATVTAQATDWKEAFAHTCSQATASDHPLLRLAQELQLEKIEVLTIALAAAVEDDLMTGRVLAHLQIPIGGSRPTLGLIATAFGILAPTARHPIECVVNGAALHNGLLTLPGEGQPLPERALTVPLHLCFALAGQDGVLPGLTIGLQDNLPIALPPSILSATEIHAQALAAADRRVLVLRTRALSEGKAVAAKIAERLKRRPVFIATERTDGLAPWLILRDLLPVFCWELGPGERRVLPSFASYRGPVLVICGPDGSVEAESGSTLNWTIPVPCRQEREALWQQALGTAELARDLAQHHRHSSGRITYLSHLAQHHNALRHAEGITKKDILAASWSTEGGSLDALAQPVTDEITDEALVVGPALQQELEALLLRCRARDGLVTALGVSAVARYHPGVRALFVGPSGTGKTLAAAWLATKLGLPLYRVDLASVTSKYIGETEKNLSQLLARAEQAEVILLFDEADSLFGKRTDIRDSNDRFANAQTNYLLQRIESYDGITLLTSNSKARFDQAFTRRLDVVIEFLAPSAEERRRLWLSHLGQHHSLSLKELNQLSVIADLCGGHIRNAVLQATVQATARQAPLQFHDVLAGLRSEYQKLGKVFPLELNAPH